MDNHRIDLTWEGDDRLREVLTMLLSKWGRRDKRFTHYLDDPDYGLILYWTDRDHATKLPRPMSMKRYIEFAIEWLHKQDYGKEPDHDGSNGKGWRVFNESWGHVKSDWGGICAIQPVWAMYGK